MCSRYAFRCAFLGASSVRMHLQGTYVKGGLMDEAPAGAAVTMNPESSYCNSAIFQSYLRHFVKHIPAARPVLLLLDGYNSHLDAHALQFAADNQIIVVALPAHW
jgi:DDE superfamily endonuclease